MSNKPDPLVVASWKALTEKRRILLVELHDGIGLERVYGAARVRQLHVLQQMHLIDLGLREERVEVTRLGHAVAELCLQGGHVPKRVPDYAGALAQVRDALAALPKSNELAPIIAIADAELALPDPDSAPRAEQVERKEKAEVEPVVVWRRLIGNTKGGRRLDYYYLLCWCAQPKGFYPNAEKHRIMLRRLSKHGLARVSGYAKLSDTGVALLRYLEESRKTEAGRREVRLGKV